jgi:hypothetical protein
MYDREVIITEPRSRTKAVLFAFHGCLQTVTQWGFKSKSCPVCQGKLQLWSREEPFGFENLGWLKQKEWNLAGMPEEMMTVYNAIKRGYAVVALGPHRAGDLYGCFNTTWPPKGYHELPDVSPS